MSNTCAGPKDISTHMGELQSGLGTLSGGAKDLHDVCACKGAGCGSVGDMTGS